MYSFDFGCKFKITNPTIKDCDGLPGLFIDYNNLNENCTRTWNLFGTGKTKGVFQLEENLGRGWSKRVQPTSIEDISALVSLIRPGCLNAKLDGKSMTQHYVDRKHGKEEVQYIHPALERILDTTFGILTYQEQSIRIASELAGFNLQQADDLRKGMGKKKKEIIDGLRNTFVEGAKNVGLLSEEQAVEIFDNIEKSNRYAFNKSHGIGYGKVSYWTAYAKTHFPLHFCCSYLTYAREKISPQDEIDEIINDSKGLGVDILTPDIRYIFGGDPGDFAINNKKINFGIRSIKGCGDKNIQKLLEIIKQAEIDVCKSIQDFTWTELLFTVLLNCSKTVVNGLISVGGCSHFGISRQTMLHEYAIASNINDSEIVLIRNNLRKLHSFEDCLDYLLNSNTLKKLRLEKVKNLVKTLKNPPFNLDDNISWIAEKERFYLGSSISCLKSETVNISGDTKCKEYNDGKTGKMSVVGEIKSIREFILKNGKMAGEKICFGTLEDSSGRLDYVLSVEKYKQFKDIAYKGNIVMLSGKRSNSDNFQVESVVTV